MGILGLLTVSMDNACARKIMGGIYRLAARPIVRE
jgi:hypothetical protein